MRKKLLCMLLASTMLCASGTTVYAAEQPAAQAQAEVTDASGDETDAAVAEEAETLETEEDLDCIFTMFTIPKTVWRRNSRHIPVPGMQKVEIRPHTIPLPVSGRSK